MTFQDFLQESFSAIRRTAPSAFAAMCRELAPREMRLCVDAEAFNLRFTPSDAELIPGGTYPAIEVTTTATSILAMIDARMTLLGAVLADALVVRGAPSDILAFHDGLLAYLHGTVRSPSLAALLVRFRRDTLGARLTSGGNA